jgi:hypothetical protein
MEEGRPRWRLGGGLTRAAGRRADEGSSVLGGRWGGPTMDGSGWEQRRAGWATARRRADEGDDVLGGREGRLDQRPWMGGSWEQRRAGWAATGRRAECGD